MKSNRICDFYEDRRGFPYEPIFSKFYLSGKNFTVLIRFEPGWLQEGLIE